MEIAHRKVRSNLISSSSILPGGGIREPEYEIVLAKATGFASGSPGLGETKGWWTWASLEAHPGYAYKQPEEVIGCVLSL